MLSKLIICPHAFSYHRKEISWQEFRNQYLEPGLVERVVVVNKSMAK